MKRWFTTALIGAVFLGLAGIAAAATEVKMIGDARIHGTYFSHQNYTGWNTTGTRTSDTFTIWQRFRLRTDFIASEGLKFRLGIRVNNTPWGNGTYTVDNPQVSIDVYQAYLQFKWPGTDIEFTIGLQDWTLPMSNADFFNANPVFGGSRSAAAVVSIPVSEQFKVIAAYTRLLDGNRDFDPTTTQAPDEFDAFVLSLPITLDGFTATPWGMMAVAGRNAPYATTFAGNAGASLASNLRSAGTALAPAGMKDAQDIYWWAGAAFALTALDPFKFYADVMYGEGNATDRGKNKRGGLFFDVAAEYTGLDQLTPQLTFWYSTGEDSSTRNGSERLPSVMGYWGPGNSFLFDSSQDIGRGCMILNPIGNWGVVASLNKMTFVKDLTHRLTFTYAHGNNSPRALRAANALWGTANYVTMGRDLTTNEYVLGVNFDNHYNIYENLVAIVEGGWSHGQFESSVWGRRLVNQANSGDAVMLAVGLKYRF